jgi:hypothetical protein
MALPLKKEKLCPRTKGEHMTKDSLKPPDGGDCNTQELPLPKEYPKDVQKKRTCPSKSGIAPVYLHSLLSSFLLTLSSVSSFAKRLVLLFQ